MRQALSALAITGLLGCSGAATREASIPPAVPETAPVNAAETSPDPLPSDWSSSALEVSVDGSKVVVAGKMIGADSDLAAAIERARGAGVDARILFVSSVSPDADRDEGFGRVLAALHRGGIERVRVEAKPHPSVTFRFGAKPTGRRFVAMQSPSSFVLYDLEAVTAEMRVGAPAPDDAQARQQLRRKLAEACSAMPCEAEIAIATSAPIAEAMSTLNAWEKATTGLVNLRPVVTLISTLPPRNAEPGGGQRPSRPKTSVAGRLPPPVIQTIVRRSFDKLRRCYETGLARNSALEGRISARFVIGRDGRVSKVSDDTATFPDAEVVACVLREVEGLVFPAPENGIVTVVYPIVFAPE